MGKRCSVSPASAHVLVTGKRRAFVSSTAVAALAVAGYFSPISVNDARADCVVATGGSPDTMVCTGSDTNGASSNVNSSEAAGLNITIQPGASVTNSGTNTSVNVSVGGFGGVRAVNVSMPDTNSSISGVGTQVNVTSLARGISGTWDIGGTIQSTGGNAIVVQPQGGTGATGITMNILPTGEVKAAGDAIVINHGLIFGGFPTGVGSLNYTLNNDGTIFAGGDWTARDDWSGFMIS